MKAHIFIIASLGCFLLAGCGDSDSPVNPTDIEEPPDTSIIQQFDPTEHEMVIGDFPCSVGDRWTYATSLIKTDTSPEYDTVVVTIVDSLAFDCGQADCPGSYQQIWQLSYSDSVDSMTVKYLHDSVYFGHPVGRVSAHFPLVWHKSWVESLSPDEWNMMQVNSMVTSVTPVTLWNGTGVLYWTIEGLYNYVLGVNRTVELTVAPGIGIVRVVSHSETVTWPNTVVTRYGWQLISWNVD